MEQVLDLVQVLDVIDVHARIWATILKKLDHIAPCGGVQSPYVIDYPKDYACRHKHAEEQIKPEAIWGRIMKFAALGELKAILKERFVDLAWCQSVLERAFHLPALPIFYYDGGEAWELALHKLSLILYRPLVMYRLELFGLIFSTDVPFSSTAVFYRAKLAHNKMIPRPGRELDL